MKLELSEEEIKLLIDGLEDLVVALMSAIPKGPISTAYNAHIISIRLLLNKIKKQTEVEE